MNTSPHINTLSAEQLEGFLQKSLPADEMQRVQRLLDDCELSREALEGYALVPGAFADVDALKKSIAKKSGMNSFSWTTAVLGVVGLAVVSLLFAIYYPATPPAVTVNNTIQHTDTITVSTTENILSPQGDHFVNPDAQVVPVVIPKKQSAPVDTEEDADIQTVKLLPVGDLKIVQDSVPLVPAKAEPSYNAQVGFILDLKVTEYDTYYRDAIEVKETPLPGIPAQFEDNDKMKGDDADGETVRKVPADQFLREGLLAFRDGRYGKCVSKMEVLLNHNPNDINALFYTAVSYVKLEMYSKAIPLLDKIIADENNVFDEEAEWYKALALDGNGDSVAAQTLFKKIADGRGFYAEQSRRKLR